MFDSDTFAAYYLSQELDDDCFTEEEHTVTCKYCGKAGFQWKETEAGWRLHDEEGELHRCKEYKK